MLIELQKYNIVVEVANPDIPANELL